MAITIDPTLKSLIPPLTSEEYRQLEANLRADGCLNPLIIWQEEQVLLDGHNRLQLCEQHGLDYQLQELSLPDVISAKLWILRNQHGRRNLTPEQMRYSRGEEYNLQKQQGKRTDLTSDHNDTKSQNTAQRLAVQHHVSEPTIKRDGAYATAVDTLAEMVGPEVRQALISRDLKLTQHDVKLLGTLLTASPETVQAFKDALTGPNPAEALKAILRTARCDICHRPLRDPASVSRGIGPVCAGHGNGLHGPSGGSSALPILTEVQNPDPPEAAPSWQQQVYTGEMEWYTPDAVLALVRDVLGQIDVDPASCAVAQATVQARTFYTIDDDGLRQPWPGTVFCNPPYKLPDVARFIGKLCEELDAQRTTAAIVLVNNATETDWFQRAFAQADAVCFPDGKIHFVSATRNGLAGPCVGQALLYYGPDPRRFCTVFAALGVSTLVAIAAAAEPQLILTAPAPLIPERAYCIVHVSLSKKGSVDFDPCTIEHCHQLASYLFWTHDPRPTGRVWVCRHRLCPAHAEAWCTVHQVDICTIATIASPAWIRAYTTGDYDQVPWFRFAAPGAPALAEAPAIPPYDAEKFVLGKLCANKHEWGQTGQTLRRINGRGCQQCDTAKKRQQYVPRKENDGD